MTVQFVDPGLHFTAESWKSLILFTLDDEVATGLKILMHLDLQNVWLWQAKGRFCKVKMDNKI